MKVSFPTAAKVHGCVLCSGRIERGERHASWHCGRAHEDCAQLAEMFDAWGPIDLRRELRAMGEDLSEALQEIVERRGIFRRRSRRSPGPLFDTRRCPSFDRSFGVDVQCVLPAGHPSDGSDAFAYHLGPKEGPNEVRRVWADRAVAVAG